MADPLQLKKVYRNLMERIQELRGVAETHWAPQPQLPLLSYHAYGSLTHSTPKKASASSVVRSNPRDPWPHGLSSCKESSGSIPHTLGLGQDRQQRGPVPEATLERC